MSFTSFQVKTLRSAALAVAVAAALAACGGKGDQQAAGGGAAGEKQQQGPAPVVGVVTVQPQRVTISSDLPGRLVVGSGAGLARAVVSHCSYPQK